MPASLITIRAEFPNKSINFILFLRLSNTEQIIISVESDKNAGRYCSLCNIHMVSKTAHMIKSFIHVLDVMFCVFSVGDKSSYIYLNIHWYKDTSENLQM